MRLFNHINYIILASWLSIGASAMIKEDQNIFSEFYNAVTQKDNSTEKQILVDEFLSEVNKNGYPLYENDSKVILLYQGNVTSVAVLGDMGDWVDKLYMHRIDNTNLFYFRGNYEPDARLEYWLLLDENQNPIIDPLNNFIVRNGLGKISELAMPKYKRHPLFDNFIQGEIGRSENLDEFSLASKFLSYDHVIHVYLPPDYQESDKKYPVVYFQDGKDYIEFAVVPHILDSMIKDKLIEPVIAVFITPPNLHQPKEPNRSTEYGLNDEYVSFFVFEVVPFVDNKFRTIVDPDARLLIGDSYGGLISLYIGLLNSELFGKVYSQSGYYSFNKDEIIKLIDKSETKELRIYFDCGIYEKQVGAAFIPEEERNFLEGNRRLKKVLATKGYEFNYFEYPEGHTWGNWRRHLIDALKYFLNEDKC
ncbi:MAG: esterase family protein [Bacteroidetes bacterium]|nr:esterase family protein [Bacteroidota bacterium]